MLRKGEKVREACQACVDNVVICKAITWRGSSLVSN